MNNYEFCVNWAIQQGVWSSARILDYGCGAGEIVKMLRLRGLDAYGTDVFYEGGDYSPNIDRDLLGVAIRRMHGSTIPFDDGYFDVVINNQVLEHVPDLDDVLREIGRVLRPGREMPEPLSRQERLARRTLRNALLHWFPKGSRARVYYAAALRLFGLGYHTRGKSVMLEQGFLRLARQVDLLQRVGRN